MRVDLLVVWIIAAMSLAGCTAPVRKNAVPEELTTQAVVPGLSDVRYRTDIDVESVLQEGTRAFEREMSYLASRGHRGPLPPAIYLAVSGGGDNGAFSAGFLNGWSEAGDRPKFKLVTGVSTGAFIAPFAFLGEEYDDRLKRFYTTLAPSDIRKKRPLIAALTNDALADNAPLWELIEKEVDQALLDAIAEEYNKGRLLLVATVDLDARHSVLWNMTRIAASSDPKALHLFRSIMIASAAIPGHFPPVMIDVEAGGREYQEMHVDGGTASQVFVYPLSLKIKELSLKNRVVRERRVYIIRNARLDPDWAEVDRKTLTIAERAITTLIQTQGIGDIYRIYLASQRDDVDFNLAYIPKSFDASHTEEFDTGYMRALYDTGYELAAKNYPWKKIPPSF